MDTGDLSWVLISTALVMLMTPAVGYFYSGLIKKKNSISIFTQALLVYSIVSILWFFIGYTLAFSNSIGGVIGDLSLAGLRGVEIDSASLNVPTLPEILFFAFELTFAANATALIIGSVIGRVRFIPLLLFLSLWVLAVYVPIAHWVWNVNGWLKVLGTLDFAGGTVVQMSSGFGALACAIVTGRSKKPLTGDTNVVHVLLGTALIWFGWFGFNGGSALAASPLAISAFISTNLAASAGGLSFMILDLIENGKPSVTSLSFGIVCGLVAITPAAGFVNFFDSIIIGTVSGIVCYMAAYLRSETSIDDALDVFAVNSVGGVWGMIATGLFATTRININGSNGLLFGNPHQLVVQFIAIITVSFYSFIVSYLILKIVNMLSPLRVNIDEESEGLDIYEFKESIS